MQTKRVCAPEVPTMTPMTPMLCFSGLFGLLNAGVSYLLWMDSPDAGTYAAISGLSAFGVLLLVLLLSDQRKVWRLGKAEKLLPCPPSFRVGAKLREENRISNIYVYLCRDELVLVSVDRKTPVLTRLCREGLRQIEMASRIQLNLLTLDGRSMMMLSPHMETLISELRKAGWPVTDRMG